MTNVPHRLPCQEHRGVLWFAVKVGDRQISAFLSDFVWQARHPHSANDESLTERYRSNRSAIDEAVVRRVVAGARDPVVLRTGDL